MEKEKVKRLILEDGLTIIDMIDALVDINKMEGIGIVALGVDLKAYCVDKAKGIRYAKNEGHLLRLHGPHKKTVLRFVVIDEHTLGHTEEGTGFANALHASTLKGATFTTQVGDRIYLAGRNVRTARWADFDAFNISSEGYRQGSAVHQYLIDP